MTREERLQILGAEVVADIHRQVAAAPPAPPELVARLRPILSHPAKPRPRAAAAPAA